MEREVITSLCRWRVTRQRASCGSYASSKPLSERSFRAEVKSIRICVDSYRLIDIYIPTYPHVLTYLSTCSIGPHPHPHPTLNLALHPLTPQTQPSPSQPPHPNNTYVDEPSRPLSRPFSRLSHVLPFDLLPFLLLITPSLAVPLDIPPLFFPASPYPSPYPCHSHFQLFVYGSPSPSPSPSLSPVFFPLFVIV